MRITSIAVACCLGCYACGCATRSNHAPMIDRNESKAVTDSLRKILEVRMPDHLRRPNPKKDGTEFNLADMFQVLKRLSMEEGWQPDYDYHFDGMGGFPIVYARGPNGQRADLLEHVRTDSTSDGFFQLALFTLMHDQFYLWWHAGYRALTPVVSAGDTKELPDEVRAKVKRRDLAPTVVRKSNGEVVVSICVFGEWSGLERVPIRMNTSFPHNPEDDEDGARALVPYDSGIRF